MGALAQCVGLWLAEGDRKTKNEITFTNNNLDLVILFKRTIENLFFTKKSKIYVYSKEKDKPNLSFPDTIIHYYLDDRANKPCYLFRFNSTHLLKEWHEIVNEISEIQECYIDILRGFFAGEGNIKRGSHNSRCIRMAQKKEMPIINNILNFLGVTFRFKENESGYIITGKWNWDKLATIDVASLHHKKHIDFWISYRDFKEDHYQKFYLKNKVYDSLYQPRTTRELSKIFHRGFYRAGEVLSDLKQEGKAMNFRVGSIDYWTNKRDIIIISKRKQKYLNLLRDGKKTIYTLAEALKINNRPVEKRLLELQHLGLIEKKNNEWKITKIDKKIIVI